MPGDDVASQRAQQRVGTLLKDKWTIDRVLGIGGFGVVYAATHRTRKRVAIKVLHPELSINAEMRVRFMREAYAANTVDHPGVVSVFDDDVTDDGAAFLVMELCEGETIDARAERMGGRLPVQEVIFVADQLLDVLAAAHDKGIVHRDVKPENLFITRGGQIKVLDFGIARMRESGDPRATRSGSLMGTPAFMPPEQARGEWRSVDARTDLWAVGAAMFTLLTGRLVHEAPTAPQMLVAAMTQPAPPLASVWPGAPEPLAHVVDRALAFDKEARWPDARQMQAALRQVSSVMLGTSSPSIPRIEAPVTTGGDPAYPPAQPPSVPAASASSPSMSRAEAVAFANTLAAEKGPPVPAAPGQARGGRAWIGIALAVAGLVVLAGLFAEARTLLATKAAPAAAPSAAPAAAPSAAAPPSTASAPPPSLAPDATDSSAAPTATAASNAPALGPRHPVAPAVGAPRPRPPEPVLAPTPTPTPTPTTPPDPYSRRR